MLRIGQHIAIDDSEIEEDFVRASGPGGQNVNKVSTAVQLRFDARRSPSLPEDVRRRLERLAGKRLSSHGVVVITAQRFRSQARNREDARARLLALLEAAARPSRVRRPTQPTQAAKARRVEAKKRRARVKERRGRPLAED